MFYGAGEVRIHPPFIVITGSLDVAIRLFDRLGFAETVRGRHDRFSNFCIVVNKSGQEIKLIQSERYASSKEDDNLILEVMSPEYVAMQVVLFVQSEIPNPLARYYRDFYDRWYSSVPQLFALPIVFVRS